MEVESSPSFYTVYFVYPPTVPSLLISVISRHAIVEVEGEDRVKTRHQVGIWGRHRGKTASNERPEACCLAISGSASDGHPRGTFWGLIQQSAVPGLKGREDKWCCNQ